MEQTTYLKEGDNLARETKALIGYLVFLSILVKREVWKSCS